MLHHSSLKTPLYNLNTNTFNYFFSTENKSLTCDPSAQGADPQTSMSPQVLCPLAPSSHPPVHHPQCTPPTPYAPIPVPLKCSTPNQPFLLTLQCPKPPIIWPPDSEPPTATQFLRPGIPVAAN